MSLCSLPEIGVDHRLSTAQFDLRPDALARWEPGVRAQSEDDVATISIYDVIGEGMEGSGVTASRISGALRSIGDRNVMVNVNSPGGDFFEGVAIYNLLRTHKAHVTINVMGLAASAASLIVMSGDDILIGEGAFLMIHNAWSVAVGNRHDLVKAAACLAPLDAAMAKVYAQRAGISEVDAARLMDQETWFNGAQAVGNGFATGLLGDVEINGNAAGLSNKKAIALIESSMVRAGYSVSQRRDVFASLLDDKHTADTQIVASLQNLLTSIQGT
ncbi:head maturation protease, ClpP-related [Paraburkholderia caribensis]|uniref:head maturation protease, ClpP-related n=1 Tax=Paraburkholderia caribensis TaxID=75105 RepID=UPI001CB4C423|nr:head maturation protease, ClpP-related [Paraburkholderia caribensis]CAG9262189.1 Prophage Clp protease-like protein [Paraburkholderia caribensis]